MPTSGSVNSSTATVADVVPFTKGSMPGEAKCFPIGGSEISFLHSEKLIQCH